MLKNLSICLTLPSLYREFGGPVAAGSGLVDGLRRLGHEVTIVGCGPAEADGIAIPPLMKFHSTPIPRRVSPIIKAIAHSDVVHIFGYRDPVGTIAALASRRRGIPYLLEPAGMYGPKLRSFKLKAAYEHLIGRTVINSASAFLATSQLEARELTESGIDSVKIRVRPNGVAVDDLLPLPVRGAFRSRYDIPRDAPLVLSLGRIARIKQLDHLAQALAQEQSVWGVVVGPDDEDGGLRDLQKARRRHNLGKRLIVIPEGVWGRDRAQLLSDADCFCMPSAGENFGTAAVEAAAVGLPVIISDKCGSAEWLNPEGSIVFAYGDIPALAAALSRIVSDQRLREGALESARELRSELGWSKICDRQVDIYRALCEPEL